VTAAQLRETVDRLRAACHWHPGNPDIWIMLDSGYDVTRLAFLLADLPVVLIGRLRSDRVLARPVAPRRSDARGRPPRHGPLLVLAEPTTWPAPNTPAAPTPPATAPPRPAPGIAVTLASLPHSGHRTQ
jgi:DDE superfamily endonuclease